MEINLFILIVSRAIKFKDKIKKKKKKKTEEKKSSLMITC
jgi:hypothetical protein